MEIFERDVYFNNNIPYIFNKTVIEYDMENAGFNLIKEFELLPKNEIDRLSKYNKKKQTVEIGKLQAKNEKFKINLNLAFSLAREKFFKANNLLESDIISIKKDAIFTIKKCNNNIFGYINFREKNVYSSYIRFNNRLEIYYNSDSIDVKGISDDMLKYHQKYFLSFLKDFCYKMEHDNKKSILIFIRLFIDDYKHKKLDINYYRRFDSISNFDILDYDDNSKEYMESLIILKNDKSNIDIMFNFHLILKLLKILI